MKPEKENRDNSLDQLDMSPASSSGSDICCLQESGQLKRDENLIIFGTKSVDPIIKPTQEQMRQIEDGSVEAGESNCEILKEMGKTIDQLLASWIDRSELIDFEYLLQQESKGLQSEIDEDADWKQSQQATNESTEHMNHIPISKPDDSIQFPMVELHLQDLAFDPDDDYDETNDDVLVNTLTSGQLLEDLSPAKATSAELPEEPPVIAVPANQCIPDPTKVEADKGGTIGKKKRRGRPRKGDKERKEQTSSCPTKSKKSVQDNVCIFCDKKFRRPYELEVHVRIHTGEQPFKCPQCGKCFSRKSNLDQHQRLHAGIKPFTCNVCNKSFAEKGNLQRHQLLHAGEKPHQCSQCEQSFTEKGHLVVHERRAHTGLKPFQCEECEMKFVTTSDLKRHSLEHSGEKPFQCNLCEKGFVTSKGLKSHIFCHNKKQFPCTYDNCQKKFSRMDALKGHVMRVHNPLVL